MRKCKEIAKLYGAYIYGDTTSEETTVIREHLNSCEKCRADVEMREKVLNVMPNKLPHLSTEERQQIAWSVRAKIRETREKCTWWQAATPFVHTASLAASLVIVFAGGTLFGLHLREHMVSTSIPPPKEKNAPVSQPQPAPPEQAVEPDDPGEFQSPQITSGDPFIRSLSGTSRSGWDWRMGLWTIPEQNTEPQPNDNSSGSEGTAEQPKPEENQQDEGSGALFDQTGTPFNPWMPVYPGLSSSGADANQPSQAENQNGQRKDRLQPDTTDPKVKDIWNDQKLH